MGFSFQSYLNHCDVFKKTSCHLFHCILVIQGGDLQANNRGHAFVGFNSASKMGANCRMSCKRGGSRSVTSVNQPIGINFSSISPHLHERGFVPQAATYPACSVVFFALAATK